MKFVYVLLAVVVVTLLAIGGWYFYKWEVSRSNTALTAAIAAAQAQGYANANAAQATAANQAMTAAMANLLAMQAATNKQISQIHTNTTTAQTKIDNYQPNVNNPSEVETWANDLTSTLFTHIQTDSTVDNTK